ncbi:MAG: hypothetical protein JNM62_14225 [Flavobacteriales bacterium]|nr:hypothetical protein [Flavobacteriales bacterium]
MEFGEEADAFIRAASQNGVRLLLVGGGAVNFHGYQRQSPDIDFWIEPTAENFVRLADALRSIGYEVDRFPDPVLKAEQNISLKMSPGIDLEVITFLRSGFTFDEGWERAARVILAGGTTLHVLSFNDLVESKLRAARPKDLLDVQELKRRKGMI